MSLSPVNQEPMTDANCSQQLEEEAAHFNSLIKTLISTACSSNYQHVAHRAAVHVTAPEIRKQLHATRADVSPLSP